MCNVCRIQKCAPVHSNNSNRTCDLPATPQACGSDQRDARRARSIASIHKRSQQQPQQHVICLYYVCLGISMCAYTLVVSYGSYIFVLRNRHAITSHELATCAAATAATAAAAAPHWCHTHFIIHSSALWHSTKECAGAMLWIACEL